MNLKTNLLAGVAVLACSAAAPVFAQDGGKKVRTIIFNEDRNQNYMCTKVYKLKNVKGADITPYILGAVKRRDAQSSIERLNYKAKGEQYIVVNTTTDMMPYVDQMVEKLDRPGTKDENGSLIKDTGIYRYVYQMKYRPADSNLRSLLNTVKSGDDGVWNDTNKNIMYFKGSKSDSGGSVGGWLKALDRPTPQMQFKINVYSINKNDFKEIGMDWASWKNGPGASLFSTAFDYINYKSFTDISNLTQTLNIVGNGPVGSMTGLGGFVLAPEIDATFLRLLAQKGKANVATSAVINVVNGHNGQLVFTPSLQNIQKDSSNNISVEGVTMGDFTLNITNPVINYDQANIGTKTAVDPNMPAARATFTWTLAINDLGEKLGSNALNAGIASGAVINVNSFGSKLTIENSTEKMIATYVKKHRVNQKIGIPWLKDIPVVGYLFGTSVQSITENRVFVTIEANPVTLDNGITPVAANVVEEVEAATK